MNIDRIEFLREDIRQYVFHLLDSEPEIGGMDAGKIAADVEREFLRSIMLWDVQVTVADLECRVEARHGKLGEVVT